MALASAYFSRHLLFRHGGGIVLSKCSKSISAKIYSTTEQSKRFQHHQSQSYLELPYNHKNIYSHGATRSFTNHALESTDTVKEMLTQLRPRVLVNLVRSGRGGQEGWTEPQIDEVLTELIKDAEATGRSSSMSSSDRLSQLDESEVVSKAVATLLPPVDETIELKIETTNTPPVLACLVFIVMSATPHLSPHTR